MLNAFGERVLKNTTSVGTPVEYRNVITHFKTVIRETGLPNIRFHNLRHTVATLLLSKEINPKIVQEQLGHASIHLTLNTYSYVIKSMRGIAANALEEVVGAAQVCQKYAKYVSMCRTDWTRCNVEPKNRQNIGKKDRKDI